MQGLWIGIVVAAAVAAGAQANAMAQAKSAAPAKRAGDAKPADKPGAYKEIKWSYLLPPGWDPVAELRAANPRAAFDDSPESMLAMREVWDKAPTLQAIDGERVKLPGYVVPLTHGQEGLGEYLLVPYFGACIHSPPPPANQIVHVVADPPSKGIKTMDVVWVSGTLRTLRHDSGMGVSGYRLEAAAVEPFVRRDDKGKNK